MSDDEIRSQLMGYSRQFETVSVPPTEVIRRRLRRRRIKLAAVAGSSAGMLAISAAVAAAAILPTLRPTSPPSTIHRATALPLGWVPAGSELAANAGPEAAPYVVTLGTGRLLGRRAAVRDWRTGTFLGQVRPPDGRCFQQIMGASDDRTFLLTVRGCYLFIRTWFYELRLSPSGHPEALIPIGLPKFLTYDTTFALSPNGTHLAFAASQPTYRPNRSTVTIYDLMTGAKRTWSGPGIVTSLVWAGDRTLAIGLGRNRPTPPRFVVGLRLLDTIAPGGSLLASRPLTAFKGGDPLPAARNVIYAAPYFIAQGSVWTEVARYSDRTGRPEIIFRPWLLIGHNYDWCDPLWTDGSGVHALAVCGSPAHDLRIDGNRMRLVNLHFSVQEMSPSTNPYFFAF